LRPPYTRLTRRYGEPQVTNGPTPREESPYRVDPKIQRIDSGPYPFRRRIEAVKSPVRRDSDVSHVGRRAIG